MRRYIMINYAPPPKEEGAYSKYFVRLSVRMCVRVCVCACVRPTCFHAITRQLLRIGTSNCTGLLSCIGSRTSSKMADLDPIPKVTQPFSLFWFSRNNSKSF